MKKILLTTLLVTAVASSAFSLPASSSKTSSGSSWELGVFSSADPFFEAADVAGLKSPTFSFDLTNKMKKKGLRSAIAKIVRKEAGSQAKVIDVSDSLGSGKSSRIASLVKVTVHGNVTYCGLANNNSDGDSRVTCGQSEEDVVSADGYSNPFG